MNDSTSVMIDHQRALFDQGVTVVRHAVPADTVAEARRLILAHRGLFKNTRPTPSAGHLAGFHRYPELESLHLLLTGNERIRQCLQYALEGECLRTIGLSDITINRSQPWHSDLLRGRYAEYLGDVDWQRPTVGVYKVLLYLQDGASLQYIEGSHREPKSLSSDDHAVPTSGMTVARAAVRRGDIVLMDIRCSHRGADESVYADGAWDENPRILVSTVLGGVQSPLTGLLEVGNFHRLVDWMNRYP